MTLTFDGYEQFIETFIFREKAAITIPKQVRELAYSLQIDIEIVSTDGRDYRNSKSSPEYGFYGYAVIVLRDHAKIQIPISQPRQVLYYDRVTEAFVNWYALYLSAVNAFSLLQLANGLIVPIGIELGLETEEVAPFCPFPPVWEELPIREVYVKTRNGTQFNLEITYTQPVPIEYGECSYDGKSGQTDSDKDNGLPSTGVQPQSAPNPSDPYLGLPAPSSAEELGFFFNLKQNGLDAANSDNAANGIYAIRWAWSQSCRPSGIAENVEQGIKYSDLLPSDTISFSLADPPINCNLDKGVVAVNNRTGQVYTEFYTNSPFLSVGGAPPAYFIELVQDGGIYLN